MRRGLIVAIAFLLGCNSPNIQDGVQAYEARRYEEALENLRPFADTNPDAAYLVGRILVDQKDRQQAKGYYKRAAERGHIEAAYELGSWLLQESDDSGVPWLVQAA